ncbi:hypothetical protein BJ508DRAFT_358365 [Ascobolus immersus RN42]|uniref:Uncharacterized protein n=1 Tax=Ascobolus immersus RN42 TaxID=1160509 RepID=A0A3N4IJE0_ASCIM|nr:hypothetical protein BJ508DRAFT_358365 [Ascobolus immersus RN42]
MTSSIRRPLFASLRRSISFKTPQVQLISTPSPIQYPQPKQQRQTIIYNSPPKNQALQHRTFHTTTIKMADDDAYAAFLKKQSDQSAQQDTPPSEVKTTDESDKEFFPYLNDINTFAPTPNLITTLSENYYSSDTDLPFIPVGITAHFFTLPPADKFAELIKVDADRVKQLTTEEWDPKGQYKEVVEGVKAAAKDGQAGVYEVDGEGSRKGYFVLGIGEGGLVGVRAGSVES